MRFPLRGHNLGALAISLVLGAGSCSDDDAPSARDEALMKAVDAIGAQAALSALAGLRIASSGNAFISGQGVSAEDASIMHGGYTNTVSYRAADDSWRLDYTRENAFVNVTFVYSEIISGNVGYISGVEAISGVPTGNMPSSRLGATTKTMRLLNPHLVLADVIATPNIVRSVRTEALNGRIHEILTIDDATAPIELWVDASTGAISQLATTENHHLYRDLRLVVAYEDWTTFSGALLFPRSVSVTRGEDLIMNETRTVVVENPSFAMGTFDLPADAMPMPVQDDIIWGTQSSQYHQEWASLGLQMDVRHTFVQATELAPGVFHLTGGSHHSMAIEQDNGVVIVEAPLYPERGDVILDWVSTQFSGKPVTHVIATHHHTDHTGGLRAFVAAGATVVMGAASVAALQTAFNAPSTVQPDTLANTQSVTIDIEAVEESGRLVLEDSSHPIEAKAVANTHANDMLLVFVETSTGTLVFESDLYNPGNGGASLFPTTAQELSDGIDTSGFDVSLIVGGHGGVAPLSELEAFLRR